jgi:hypothetical protein
MNIQNAAPTAANFAIAHTLRHFSPFVNYDGNVNCFRVNVTNFDFTSRIDFICPASVSSLKEIFDGLNATNVQMSSDVFDAIIDFGIDAHQIVTDALNG